MRKGLGRNCINKWITYFIFVLFTWRSHKGNRKARKHHRAWIPAALKAGQAGACQTPVSSDATCWLMVCYILNLFAGWTRSWYFIHCHSNVLLSKTYYHSHLICECVFCLYPTSFYLETPFFSSVKQKEICVKSKEKSRTLAEFRFNSSFLKCAYGIGWRLFASLLAVKT